MIFVSSGTIEFYWNFKCNLQKNWKEFEIQKNKNKLFVYDPAGVLCNSYHCGEIDQNYYLYSTDGNHLSAYGLVRVGRDMFKKIDNILFKLQ